jgi:hypothetical protein
MPKLIRIYLGRWNGTVNWTHFDGDITPQSVVLASVGEGDDGNTSASPQRFLGSANMRVDNIAPFDSGVRLRFVIDWDEPLNVWADLVVLDGFPQAFFKANP